jgi:suppressor of fused-like protein
VEFLRRFRGRPSDPAPDAAGHVHRGAGDAPGWEAISAAADHLYPGVEPQHWGTIVKWRMGGPDPLDGISAYPADDPPHWHYVSYGLSELFRKESDDPTVSGWGMELTFRLARGPADDGAPIWAFSMLQNLAKYVFESGNVLSPGDHMDAYGPIELDASTDIRAFLFVADPELGSIETQHGSLTFVQVVGITLDELEAARDWTTDGLVGLLQSGNARLVTDLGRPSIRLDASMERAIRAGIDRDGSSMTGINVDVLEIVDEGETLTIRCGAICLKGLHGLLRGRTQHGRSFWIRAPAARLAGQPGTALAWHRTDDGEVHVDLPADIVNAILETVPAKAGTYAVGDGVRLRFQVDQTIVRDRAENEIGRIG